MSNYTYRLYYDSVAPLACLVIPYSVPLTCVTADQALHAPQCFKFAYVYFHKT